MGMGLEGLGGAAGATQGLLEHLAFQLKLRAQSEAERANRAQEARLSETSAQNAAYRQDALSAQEAERSRVEADRQERQKLQRVNLSLARPIGSSMTPEELQYDTKELGIPSSYFDQSPEQVGGMAEGGGTEGPPQEIPRIRFRGKEADLMKRQADQSAMDSRTAAEAGRNERADATNLTRTLIAQMGANKGGGDHGGVVRTVKTRVGDQDMEVALFKDGTQQVIGESQLSAGQKGKQTDARVLLTQLDDIDTLGEETKWNGIGPLLQLNPMKSAAAQNLRKQLTGGGSDRDDALRIGISSIKADIAHEKYGSAFTETERKMLSNFAPDTNMAPAAARNRLKQMRRVIEYRLAELASGKSIENASPLSFDTKGSGGVRDPIPGIQPATRAGKYEIVSVE